MLDFSKLVIGREYDRPTLATLWGYESFHALGTGVFTPKGANQIILFITKEKQGTATQFEDHLEQDILFWEGQSGHGTDSRIISRKDQIYVFFRQRHHTPFVFEGRADLRGYKLFTDRPSKFTFHLIDKAITKDGIVEEIRMSYGLTETEKEAIVKSRRGQGIYRVNSLKLWGACSVTGFTKKDVLIASHIKPWKESTNQERVDHYNSLVLVPSLDKLFDKGYIGFEPTGKILISEKIEKVDRLRIGLDTSLRLKQIPDDTRKYLEYHSEYKFDLLI